MWPIFHKRPQLSIVVVIYNKENYIKDCLDSLLSQKLDMEIVCVDDHSTDSTPEILQQYATEHKNIKIMRNPQNRGTCYTRYVGMKECQGEYMMFIDGDDTVPTNSLHEIYQYGKDAKADIIEYTVKLNAETLMCEIPPRIIKNELLLAHNQHIIKNLWNKMFSRKTYMGALKKMTMDANHDDFSDVLYFLIHFLHHADSVAQTNLTGYNYFSTRGMTFNSTAVQRLFHYCNFACTYQELCRVYGETAELFYWKNYLCNQAIETYLTIPPKERKASYVHLKQLMTDDEIKFLISEKNKEKRLKKQ